MPRQNIPVSREIRISTGSGSVPNARGVWGRVVLEVAFNCRLLIVGHREVVAESTAREDDFAAGALGLEDLSRT